jgi:hypothetical protein
LDSLSDELALQLSIVHAPNYQTLLDKARILESKQKQIEGRKRKFNHGGTHSASHQKTTSLMKATEVLEIDMEATTNFHMEGMDISTTEEMATTIMATRDTTIAAMEATMAMTATKRTTS